ncbi:MAG: prolipoprotein diacylglyceryl transferase [Flavobacteriaceae bacterium]|nr:prolipoprotein diacylglyceryl transferase [Flavobacteriaceae bacterium]
MKFNWSPSETLFEIGGFGIHIYSLMFVIDFLLGYRICKKIFLTEGINQKYLEPLFMFMVISTLLGARLGDVIFYSWDYYQNHLIEILLPIRENPNKDIMFGIVKGYEFIGFRGLASHGASIGIILGLFLFQKKFKIKSLFCLLDRLTIPISLGAFFVRIGNFFNSEIVGKYTGSNFGVVFENRGEILPRHPAQLYEAIGYMFLFILLRKLYKTNLREKEGIFLGVFFLVLFGVRFLVEFVKESQGGIEEFMPNLSTGQWLSIPFIFLGIIIIILRYRKKKLSSDKN